MKRRMLCLPSWIALFAVLAATTASAWAKDAPSVFDQLDLLVDVRHELVQNYVEAPDQQAMTQAAVRGMIQSLDDPYTRYLTLEQLQPFDKYVRGSFSGIGVEVDLYEDRPRIITPLDDSPAWKAGIMAGDVILAINGKSTRDLPLSQAEDLLSGDVGTKVTLKVRHESGKVETISLTRRIINIRSVRGFDRAADHHFNFMLDPANRIGYVRLTQFSQTTAKELREALEQLKAAGVRGLILDMRFNPGGLLKAAVAVSDMFLPAGETIVSVKGRTVPEKVYTATDETILPEIPVVVLANEASASAAEIVTGALSDNHRALFVGTRTFGKGSVQQVKMLADGQGALKMTDAYYYIPSGRLIHRRPGASVWGVDPSKGSYIPMTPKEVRTMIDKRREADAIRATDGDAASEAVTPGWIKGHMSDPQLAGALTAVLGKMSTGTWPQVGQADTQALVKAGERANLMLHRDMLLDELAQVRQRLAALGKDTVVAEAGAEAGKKGREMRGQGRSGTGGQAASGTRQGAGDEGRGGASPIDPETVRQKANLGAATPSEGVGKNRAKHEGESRDADPGH